MSLLCWLIGHRGKVIYWAETTLGETGIVPQLRAVFCMRCGKRISQELH